MRVLLTLVLWLILWVVSWGVPAHAAISNAIGWQSLPNTLVNNVCQFPGQGGGCAMLTDDWNGALFDTLRNRMVFGWGGGHSDYFGNEIVALSIGTTSAVTDTQTLTRVRDSSPTPQSYTGFAAVSDSTSSIGISPVARHSYSNLVYLPDQDKYLILGGGSSPQGNMTNDVWLWAPATNVYQQLANSPIDRNDGFYGSAATWDGERHVVWAMDGTGIQFFTPATNTWTTPSQLGFSCTPCADATGTHDPVRDRWYIIGGGGARYFDVKTTSTYTMVTPSTTGCTSAFTGTPGSAYDPVQDRIVIWGGGNTIYLLNPATHTCSTLTVGGGPAEVANGTFSKFQYSPKDNLFVTCQSSSSNCAALRLTVQDANSDFLRRCNSPGVTYCQGFDTLEDYTLGQKAFPGDGGFDGTDCDTTIKASGACSLRFNLPAGRGASNISGFWRDKLKSDNTGFGAGQTWYLQFRKRVTSTMISNLPQWQSGLPSGTGWKHIIVHNGGVTCSNIEMTGTTYQWNSSGAQIYYTECGAASATMNNAGTLGDPWMEQGSNVNSKTDGFWCDFNATNVTGTGNGTGCFKEQWPNEWITEDWKVRINNFTTASSLWQVWIAREGSATRFQLINMNNIYRFNTDVAVDTFDSVDFTPYMTGLTHGATASANLWIDELIVSTEPISLPGQALGPPPDTTPPAAPIGFTVR